MTLWLSTILLGFYAIALLYILMYSVMQLSLVRTYIKAKKRQKKAAPQLLSYPFVTVQLPLYNEQYVVDRLIDTVASFDYPQDRFEVQILDDSNDETVDICAKKVKEWQERGVQIAHIQRPIREGYKAGALKYGLELAQGEYIAVFDADFLPRKDFLLQTVPYLEEDKEIGVVQTRWGHINRDSSVLTKTQAFALDAHFTVEQVGRNAQGCYINFNGTGGVWRKETIIDAGNWEWDTLTEDLDLSYRAQLNGWKFKYLEDVEAPAELPATMNALKSQQFRWTKGGAESAVKNLGKVLKSDAPWSVKIHAMAHLLNSTIFIAVFLTAVLSVPVLLVKNHYAHLQPFFKVASFFLFSLLVLSVFYYQSYFRFRQLSLRSFIRFCLSFPTFLSLSMGMSLHNSIAVAEGLLGKKTPFIRTPKFNITGKETTWKSNAYRIKEIPPLTYLEAFLSFYFLAGVLLQVYYRDFNLIIFHGMLTLGFGAIAYYSFRHARAK